ALFYGFIASAMPASAPGSLPPQQYADITAYLLNQNGYPIGTEDLPPDEDILAQIDPRAIDAAGDDAASDEPAAEEPAADEPADAAADAAPAPAEPAAPAVPPSVTTQVTSWDREYTPVTDEMILDPDPADWLQWRR